MKVIIINTIYIEKALSDPQIMVTKATVLGEWIGIGLQELTVKAPPLYGILTLPRELQYARKQTEMTVARMVLEGEH